VGGVILEIGFIDYNSIECTVFGVKFVYDDRTVSQIAHLEVL